MIKTQKASQSFHDVAHSSADFQRLLGASFQGPPPDSDLKRFTLG